MQQNHLDYIDRVNLGAYYTQADIVALAWAMLRRQLSPGAVVLDTSCGYGNFLAIDSPHRKIGNDIDAVAVRTAREYFSQYSAKLRWCNVNALNNVNRAQYALKPEDELCIVGNPPYNDTTSQLRHKIKATTAPIDTDLQRRDLGMSFLLSYAKLKAEVICVLHPLSYLIKPSNFNLLKAFTRQYRLIDAKIISSGAFDQASKSTHFPIVIALYRRHPVGMDYQTIRGFNFVVAAADAPRGAFRLSDFDYIAPYLSKYPKRTAAPPDPNAILFWTLRDINALKRNRTFVDQYSQNTIVVKPSQLDYYIYVDVFKRWARHVPYYFGNCDIVIDDALFTQHKPHFIFECLAANPSLRRLKPEVDFAKQPGRLAQRLALARQHIKQYFQHLLGDHYVD